MQLLLLSAQTEQALQRERERLCAYLQRHTTIDLADVAYTLQMKLNNLPYRQILVCNDREDALEILGNPYAERTYTAHTTSNKPAITWLFPGLGEQYPGMAHWLYENEPLFQSVVDDCCIFLQPLLGLDLRQILYSDEQQHRDQPAIDLRVLFGHSLPAPSQAARQLKQTELAQPAIFVIEYALACLLRQWGIQPQSMLGYSLGEYVAACLADVFSLEDALTIVARRASLIQKVQAGAMVAVPLSEEEVQGYLDGQINLAIINGPATCILAGPVPAIEHLEARLAEKAIACRRVETTHAFHSAMLEEVHAPFTAFMRTIKLNPPRIPYISNVTGTWVTASQATDPHYWAQHMCQTVRFAPGVAGFLQEPDRVLLEVGVGRSLSSLIKQHPACDMQRIALVLSTLPSLYEKQSDYIFLLTTLGRLWLAGIPIDWSRLHTQEWKHCLPLPL